MPNFIAVLFFFISSSTYYPQISESAFDAFSYGALIPVEQANEMDFAIQAAVKIIKNDLKNNITTTAPHTRQQSINWTKSETWFEAAADAWNMLTKACNLITDGRNILVSSGDFERHELLKTVSEQFNLPFVNWALPSSVGSFEVSLYPSVLPAVADLVQARNWKRLIYVADTEAGVWNQRSLLQYLNSTKNYSVTIESIQLPRYEWIAEESIYFRFFLDFHARYYVGRHYVILDVENGQTLRRVLRDLKDAAMKTHNFHYVILPYAINKTDLNPFRNGLMNVTIFQLYNTDSPNFRRFQSVSNEIYQKRRHGNPPWTILPPSAVLAYDSIFTIVEAAFEFKKLFRNFYDVGSPEATNVCQLDIVSETTAAKGAGRNSAKFAQSFVNVLKEVKTTGLSGAIAFDQNGFRKNYSLDVLELSFHSDERGYVGTIDNFTWTHGVGFSQDVGYVHNESTALARMLNRTLVLTTVETDPFVILTNADGEEPRFEGYCVDLVEQMAAVMGFKYRIKLVDDGQYGAVKAKGIWNGMVGELISGKADMVVAPLSINRARERVVDFSKPFMTTGITIMIKKPDKQEFSVFSFMQPLSKEVWMYIIFAYVGVSVVIFLISRFSPYEWRVEETAHGTYTISNDFSVYNCLWFTLAAFMQQGTDILPRSVSGRIASSAWWFFTMIIVSSYTANLAAFLTMEKMRPPFESVDELVRQTKIKYGIQRSGSTATFFQESTYQVYKRMWSYMEKNKDQVMVASYKEGIQKVRDSKTTYAFLLEETGNQYANTRKPCDTMKVGSRLNMVGYGVATPFNSPLRHPINLAILELQEKGVLKRLEDKWWYEKGQCEQGMTDSQSASLTLSKVAGIFYILLGGMIASMIVAFGEFLYRSKKEAKKKTQETDETSERMDASAHLTTNISSEKS